MNYIGNQFPLGNRGHGLVDTFPNMELGGGPLHQ